MPSMYNKGREVCAMSRLDRRPLYSAPKFSCHMVTPTLTSLDPLKGCPWLTIKCVWWWQMDSGALESSIGGRAAQRSPLQILVDIEGPDSTFQQDVSDYFCYVQLAQKASACLPS